MTYRHNRRDFLSLTGAGVAGAAGAGWAEPALASGPTEADLVVWNARVYTVDDAMPRAQAFAVKGSRFMAVGSNQEMKALVGPRTETYDAQGMTITPGFIDCHMHHRATELLYDVSAQDPFDMKAVTIDSIVQQLKARAAITPPDYWVEAYFYDDTKTVDGRRLDIRDLDKVSTTHPVMVNGRGGHTTFYNSKAFQMAGITKNTPDPVGGMYEKFPNGELSGRVSDNARLALVKVGKRKTFTPEENLHRHREGLANLSTRLVAMGLTSICQQGGNLRALEEIRAAGRLKHRVNYECYADVWEPMMAAGIITGTGDEWIRFGGTAERSTDGSLSERTMAMSVVFPGTSYKGNLKETQEQVSAWCLMIQKAGIRPNIHANGDVTIRQALTAFEAAQKAYPVKDLRPKITHCSLIDDDIVARMKALNVVPALFNTYLYYNSDKFQFYGDELMSRMMAYRTMIDAGLRPAAGADFGAGVPQPLMGIQGVTTRTGPEGKTWGANQKITVAEALKVHTLNGAYNTHEEDIKGSITPGKLADYVILAEDLHTIDPNRIKDIQVVRTVVGGATVYQA